MADEQPSSGGTARFERYSAAKTRLAEALTNHLAAVVEVGGEDAAPSLELARQMLIRDLCAAVDERLFTVSLTDVWRAMADRDAPAGERLDRGGA